MFQTHLCAPLQSYTLRFGHNDLLLRLPWIGISRDRRIQWLRNRAFHLDWCILNHRFTSYSYNTLCVHFETQFFLLSKKWNNIAMLPTELRKCVSYYNPPHRQIYPYLLVNVQQIFKEETLCTNTFVLVGLWCPQGLYSTVYRMSW